GIEVEGQQALLAGVDFESELELKRWWHIVGDEPKGNGDLLVGNEVARALRVIGPSAEMSSVMPGMPGMRSHRAADSTHFKLLRDRLASRGHEHRVAGVLAPTGGPEDRMIFGSLADVQSLVGKPDQLSLIEVSALCKDCPIGDIVAQISEKLPHAK